MKKGVLAFSLLLLLMLFGGCEQSGPDNPSPVWYVTFASNGGSFISQLSNVPDGSKISKPEDPTRSGYVFDGWYSDSTFQSKWDFATNTVTANVVLYAKWKSNYKVTFNSNGGTYIYPVTDILNGSKISKPEDPTRSGYVFDGWYSDSTFQSKWDFENNTVTADQDLYAKWIFVHSVYFRILGTYLPTIYVVDGDKVDRPADPVDVNLVFVGWYKDKDCTVLWDFDTDTVVSEECVFYIYSKWYQKTNVAIYPVNISQSSVTLTGTSSISRSTPVAEYSVSASSIEIASRQWYLDGTAIPDSDTDTLVIDVTNPYLYSGPHQLACVVTDLFGVKHSDTLDLVIEN